MHICVWDYDSAPICTIYMGSSQTEPPFNVSKYMLGTACTVLHTWMDIKYVLG